MSETDRRFAGSIPQIYERYLVPLIFESYAADLAARVATRNPRRLLELAAGTGVLTRALARTLPANTSIVATDLNQAMLDHAASIGTAQPAEWRQADAMKLPFPDESFDAVVCQFGAMFFPDKPRAYSEAKRVLRPGGLFGFNVWDRIEENEFAGVVTRALTKLFPQDPPLFLPRIPHSYHDLALIRQDLAAAGFNRPPEISTVAQESRAESACVPAIAYCQGTPLRNEIESRVAALLNEATDSAAAAIEERFGIGPVAGKIQAHIILVEK
jgi:ubiquinone/menaquinone biosynthesis C-methylase UbiE